MMARISLLQRSLLARFGAVVFLSAPAARAQFLDQGAVNQTVTVTSAPPLLQSQNSSVGQVLSSQQIADTPLNSRNAVYLVQMTAGAVPSKGSRRFLLRMATAFEPPSRPQRAQSHLENPSLKIEIQLQITTSAHPISPVKKLPQQRA
jgi:hypothetical protein